MADLTKPSDLNNLIETMGRLIEAARGRAIHSVNHEMVMLYWELGRHIVEYEQEGQERAAHAEELLSRLAGHLTDRFGRGFSERNLRNFRQFCLAFQKWQSVPAKLSWTHLLHILRVQHPLARDFYLRQAEIESWSTRELERQINSMLFERPALCEQCGPARLDARAGHRAWRRAAASTGRRPIARV